jgi:hypothetical protein
MGFFYSRDHKYVVNWHFHKQSLAIGMWQVFSNGPIYRFLKKIIFIINEIEY